jgi:hypothetical protein
MTFRVSIGPRMSGGDRALAINGRETGCYVSDGFGGKKHLWGDGIQPAPGKINRPYDSVSAVKSALIRALIECRGDVAAALQYAGTGRRP